MTCRTCKYLDVPPNKSGKRIAYTHQAYRCTAPLPELPALPQCMADNITFIWPPRRNYMTPEYGKSCPAHEKREKP